MLLVLRLYEVKDPNIFDLSIFWVRWCWNILKCSGVVTLCHCGRPADMWCHRREASNSPGDTT